MNYYTSIQIHRPVPHILTWDVGRGIKRLLQLQLLSYQPQALLQRTKQYFEREEFLGERQTIARAFFIRTFQTGKREFRLDQTESLLRSLMRSLDDFFFSGLLTGGTDPIVRLEFGENIFNEIGTPGKGGLFTIGMTEGGEDASTVKLRIILEACDPIQSWRAGHRVRFDLFSLLETLVHEMAHAYYISFTCPCGYCQREMGATGHGPVWQELKQAMYMTMRGWDPSLASFYMIDEDVLDDVIPLVQWQATSRRAGRVSRGRMG